MLALFVPGPEKDLQQVAAEAVKGSEIASFTLNFGV
jgi:hypothetical protein